MKRAAPSLMMGSGPGSGLSGFIDISPLRAGPGESHPRGGGRLTAPRPAGVRGKRVAGLGGALPVIGGRRARMRVKAMGLKLRDSFGDGD